MFETLKFLYVLIWRTVGRPNFRGDGAQHSISSIRLDLRMLKSSKKKYEVCDIENICYEQQ